MPSDIAWPSVPSPRSTGNLKNRVLLGHPRHRHLFGDDLAVGLANRDAIAVGRAHHDAFHDGLAADEGFLAALEDREHLNMREKTKESTERTNMDLESFYYTLMPR